MMIGYDMGMSNLTTKSGKPLNPIGIGTWNIASKWTAGRLHEQYHGTDPAPGNEAQEIEALRYSIAKGQNHIDCAELYGAFYTDEVVGRALAGAVREDLYIADKLWKTSLAPGKVRPIVQQMLQKLGTDYIDLLYIHSSFPGWQEAVPQIDQLIDEGIVRHFGVSNFTLAQMQEALALAKHPIVANQMNYNVLYKDEVDQAFRDYCKQHGIQIVAYQPVKRQEVLTDKTVQKIARAHGATPAQVALAWLLQMGSLPIPKAVQKAHIDENLGALDLKLSDNEMQKLTDL